MKTQNNDQVTPTETAEILRLAEQTLNAGVGGDFVELGCYRGDTSVLLGKLLQKHSTHPSQKCPSQSPQKTAAQTSQKHPNQPSLESRTTDVPKHLWIYDSFAGLPEKTREDASGAGANFQAGELFVTKREVIDKLRKNGLKTASHATAQANCISPQTSHPQSPASHPLSQNGHPQPPSPSRIQPTVIVKKAWFDDLTPEDLPEKISFAFCDGDLYGSIKTSLKLVAPKLEKQGIIIVHDYNNPELPGSSKAVDEFLRAHSAFKLQVRYSLAIIIK